MRAPAARQVRLTLQVRVTRVVEVRGGEERTRRERSATDDHLSVSPLGVAGAHVLSQTIAADTVAVEAPA